MTDRLETAIIHGSTVRYRVRRSKRARRLTLHVSTRKGLEIVLPWRWPLRDVKTALVEHAAWIDRNVDHHGVRHGPLQRELVNDAQVPVLGVPRRLALQPLPPGRSRATVVLDDDSLQVRLPASDLLTPRPPVRRWLQRFAKRHLTARVAELALRHGFKVGKIIVGERTSRWGSCSARGNLSFCDRLAMAPPEVIDAVICHELCHLRHLNHGRRFYALLQRICPEHDQLMKWLRKHQDELDL